MRALKGCMLSVGMQHGSVFLKMRLSNRILPT